MVLNFETKSDIEVLLNIARPKLIAADNGGGSELFNEVSKKFGPVAHRVYLALDLPERKPERYHNKETRRVMLDPCTVINRARSFLDSDTTIDDEEFWLHCDMIKSLCDYIDLRNMEVINA
jgi:hypothetical protein